MFTIIQSVFSKVKSIIFRESKVITKTKKNISNNKELIESKKWYHLSFFYRGTDFQPVYFYIFCLFWVLMFFCFLKARFLIFEDLTKDVSETFILSLLGTFVTTFGMFNIFNNKKD